MCAAAAAAGNFALVLGTDLIAGLSRETHNTPGVAADLDEVGPSLSGNGFALTLDECKTISARKRAIRCLSVTQFLNAVGPVRGEECTRSANTFSARFHEVLS